MPKRPSAPVRVPNHAKPAKRSKPLSLDDDDFLWSDEPLPVSASPVPICCILKTCKLHAGDKRSPSSPSSEADREVASITCKLICEETLS